MSAAAPFVCAALLGGDEGDVSKLMTPFLGGAIPCFALVPWFARRFGWERGMLYASIALSAVYVGIAALGESAYTALQIATTLGEHGVKIVPEVAVGGGSSGSLADALIARLLAGGAVPAAKA